MRAGAVIAGVWVSLVVAAAGLWLWTGQVGVGLVAGGLATAAVLFFGVDTTGPERPARPVDRSDRRVPGL